MKKVIIISSTVFFLGIVSAIGYMIYTDKILIRPPVLVEKSPVVTYYFGQCMYRESKDDPWQKASVRTKLGEGFQVKTGKTSVMDIRFHDDTAVRITENSSFTVSHLSIKKLQIKLERGSIFSKVERLFKNHEIEFSTPTSVAAIRGTELALEVHGSDEDETQNEDKKIEKDENAEKNDDTEAEKNLSSTIYTLSGIISVSKPENKEEAVLLSNQNKITIDKGGSLTNPEKMTQKDIIKVQSALNAIHIEEVLLITDKIYFKVGSARILKSSYPELNKIAKVLDESSDKIRIEGHTDSDGKAHLNQSLSIKRAKSIREYLIKKGIKRERFRVSGYGESKPIANNKTKKGRAANRRVEFIIIE